MKPRLYIALALTIAIVAARTAHAQRAPTTTQVALTEMTVDDQPPPDSYRGMIATGLQPTLEPILQCYRECLTRDPALAGTLRVRLWVSARQVIRATEERSTLGDDALDECARRRIYEFRLPDAAPDGGAMVRLTLHFSTAAGTPTLPAGTFASVRGPMPARAAAPTVPAASAPPPPPASPAAPPEPPRAIVRVDTIRGALAADALAAAISPSAFDACPAAAGELPLSVRVAPDGRVSARATRGTIRDRAVIRCIVAALTAQRLPAGTGATRATLTVTLAR